MIFFSFLQEIMNVPNITDWMQGLGTILGVPAAIAAFILLFIKDKQKQQQIDKLTELILEHSYQTELMRESNELFKEQLLIQSEVLINDKNYKDLMKELEIKKSKSKYRPHFVFEKGESTSNELKLLIRNSGERASKLKFNVAEVEELRITTPGGISISKNGIFVLTGDYRGKENLHKIDKLIEIIYEDSIGTKYKQIFKARGSYVEILEAVEEKS
jgi:hypothetical protein